MTKSFIKARAGRFKAFAGRHLETGFSMLEAVVVVGVLLALAVSGFVAYGPITENAKIAAVKSAASQIHTAVMVADIDGDPATKPQDVIDAWNASNKKIHAEIIDSKVVIAAMNTAAVPAVPSTDLCVQTTSTESPAISAQAGACPAAAVAPAPVVTPTPTPTPIVAPAGDIFSWGINNQGNLGTNDTVNSAIPRSVFTPGVLNGKKISAVSGGLGHTCALSSGAAYCWGWGADGQLGNGPLSLSTVPIAVNTSGALAGKTITSISAGGNHTCGIAAGAAYCWGDNTWGQIGNNTLVDAGTPVAVDTSGALAGKSVTAISAGLNSTCAVADGAVYCWGRNSSGQLGNNTTVNSSIPVAVSTTGVLSGKAITGVAVASSGFACALSNGAAYCWGVNSYGQLGNGNTTISYVPVAVVSSGVLSGKTITSISLGDNHACVVASGAAYCWGMNGSGPLGTNDRVNSSAPVAVLTTGALAGKTVTSISSGGSHTCAIADDAAYCWGYNYYGTVGNNTTGGAVYAPIAVTPPAAAAGKKVVAMDLGSQHSVAIYG